MDEPVAAPAPDPLPPTGPFRVGRDGAFGRRRDVFRSRSYRAPTTGVRVPSTAEVGLVPMASAVRLMLPDGAAFSCETAAEMWRLPVPRQWSVDEPLHVTVPAGLAHVRRKGQVSHRAFLPDSHVDERCGVQITSAARTFADLAASLPLGRLVAVGDAALRAGLTSCEEIADMLERRGPSRGIRAARHAATLLDPRSESPRESELRVLIVEAGLPAPTPQGVIRDDAGEFLARGDLVYEEWRIVIEYDGEHHAEPRRRAADASRRTLLRLHDVLVVEITAPDLRFPARALAKVQGALRYRGAEW